MFTSTEASAGFFSIDILKKLFIYIGFLILLISAYFVFAEYSQTGNVSVLLKAIAEPVTQNDAQIINSIAILKTPNLDFISQALNIFLIIKSIFMLFWIVYIVKLILTMFSPPNMMSIVDRIGYMLIATAIVWLIILAYNYSIGQGSILPFTGILEIFKYFVGFLRV